jgi:hypothetical protein
VDEFLKKHKLTRNSAVKRILVNNRPNKAKRILNSGKEGGFRSGYLKNLSNAEWNSILANVNSVEGFTENQKQVFRNAAGLRPGHRVNTFLAKRARTVGKVALAGFAAARYGPYVLQTIQKARNYKKNNGRVNDSEVKRLANAWKQKGFEIKNMGAFAQTVRSSANMQTPNQAKAQFNKAFRNGTISMVVGGVASSLGTAVAANKLASVANALKKVALSTKSSTIENATTRINNVLGVSRKNVSTQNVMRAAIQLKRALQTGQIDRINANTISRMYSRLPELQRVFKTFTGR